MHLIDKLWNLRGSLMEKILDWNMEKPWSICGESQMWNICGYLTHWKITDWKNQRRATMEWYANQPKGWKNVSENCGLGEHARGQRGSNWNYFRRGWNICG